MFWLKLCDKHLTSSQRKNEKYKSLKVRQTCFPVYRNVPSNNMHRPKDDEDTKTTYLFPLFQIFNTNHPQSMMIGVKTFMTFVNNANVKEIHHEILSFCRFDLVI